MSDDYVLRESLEGILDESLEVEDLPRIVVEEERIVVLESLEDVLGDFDWVERDVASEDFEDEDEEGVLDEEDFESVEDDLNKVLEDMVVSEGLDKEDKVVDSGEFYDVGARGQEFYDVKLYEEKKDVEYVSSSEKIFDPTEVRKERSMLEIAGFRDEEAEKARKKKDLERR